MTTAEMAWAAGLFEGEGCISVGGQKRRSGGCLIIRMTDLDSLERFMSIVSVGRIRGPIAPTKANHKPSWEWRVGTWAEVERLLLEFKPWLGARRNAKADELLARPVTPRVSQLKDQCRRGHMLRGDGADVRVFKQNGRTHHQCRPCRRIRAAELRELRSD